MSTVMAPTAFADADELLQFARTFLSDRTASLERDVLVCTSYGATAAFPAILYCFSTIDLLGALLAGNAKPPRKGEVLTDRPKTYAQRFMHYSPDQCELLWDVFRHKIVHLAQPKAVKDFNGKNTTWGYEHNCGAHHLKLVPLVPPVRVTVSSKLSFEAEQRFVISIRHLAADVVHSVHAPGGYLHTLGSDNCLQQNFENAVTEIYGT